jgi:hypothetical protein
MDDVCKGCGTERKLAPGLDYFCPNKECTFERDQMFAHIREKRSQEKAEQKARKDEFAAKIRADAFQEAIDLIEEISDRRGDFIETDELGRVYVRADTVHQELLERINGAGATSD